MSGDTIAVRAIRAYGKHGANPDEREHAQPFEIDLEVEVDLQRARASDALDDTIDYAGLHATVVRLVGERSYRLLERLGDDILHDVMRDARVRAACVTIAKPALFAGATPSVTLRERRDP